MKFIDLFAGIGGFRSGLEQAGHKCIGYIEWDKFARQSYQAMYDTKGEFTANDIQQVKGNSLPAADAWTFGSPCTNISISGNRVGIKGEQSRMFFEVIRLLKERAENQKTLPTYLIMENVKNLLSSNQGRDFAEVVPQHRERIYIVGHLRGQRTRGVFPIQRQSRGSTKAKIKIIANDSKTNFCSHDIVSDHGISKTVDATSYKHVPQVAIHQGENLQSQIAVKACLTPDRLHKRQNGRCFKENNEPASTLTVADRNGVLLDDGNTVAIRKLTPRECWRLQGFSDEQFDKAKRAGVSNSQLYKQAGNAVTVPVVEAIGERLNLE